MSFALRIVVSTFAVMVAEYLLSGVSVDDLFTGIVVALVIAFLNAVVKPILLILTLPATILSFGLFYFVINAIIVLIADWAVDGFYVDGFWWALGFSLIVSLINSALASRSEDNKPMR